VSPASSALDDRTTRPAVVLLMAALFVSALAYSAVLPVLPLILQRSGLAPSAVTWHTGMLTGVYMLTVFLFAPLWGRVSDRIGRRPLIAFGLAGTTLALISFALFRTLPLAYVARALTGVFVAAVIPVATAEVGDISGQSSRAHRFALLTSASLLGFLIGPALGGWLTNASWLGGERGSGAGAYVPVATAAVLSALTAAAVALWLPGPVMAAAEAEARSDGALHRSMIQRVAPTLLVLLVMFALASFEVAITLRGQQRLGWSPAQIGFLFAECSAVMIVIQGVLFSTLISHVSSNWLIVPGLGAMIVGLTLMPLTADYGRLLLLVMLTSAGASVVAPMITYWASIGAGMAQGAALGTQTAASSLGQALGSAAVATTFSISPTVPFWLAAALLVGGAALLATSGSATPIATA
jgi:DHA1 family multidrug resistance protein-like MFS transporter